MPDKNVIVATDGSDHSLRVIPHADLLASSLGTGIEIVQVVASNEIAREPNEDEDAAIERVRSRLEGEMASDLQRYGVKAETRVILAPKGESTAQTLLGVASEGVLLAMHSRGRGGIARLLGGSVAMGVLKSITQPVMLGGPELLSPAVNGDTYRIVITTDFSSDADVVLRSLSPLLEQGKFQVTLLYIHLHAPGGVDNEAERAKHQATLESKRSLLPASVAVEPYLREIPIGGGIDTAIMEVAQELGANAIAMSTHGTSARHAVLMGSVAMSVLGRSRLPMIVARAG